MTRKHRTVSDIFSELSALCPLVLPSLYIPGYMLSHLQVSESGVLAKELDGFHSEFGIQRVQNVPENYGI